MTDHYDKLEIRDPAERERDLLAALPKQIAQAQTAAPAFAKILDGVKPGDVTTREALAKLPVTRKSELLELQKARRADDPFGGFSSIVRGPRMPRVFASPGNIYEPEGEARDYWRTARALHAAGFRSGELIHNSFSYHMTPAGSIMESGAHAMGCTVFAGGTGQTEQQLEAMVDLRPEGYAGTPSFLKILMEGRHCFAHLTIEENLLERRQQRDYATQDFLDIFNHRFLAFLYRSRRKHHIALNPQSPARSTLATTLDAASALGLRAGVRAPDGSAQWLRHAGLLGGSPRGMTALLALLRDRLGVQVDGTQFRGRWLALEPDASARLDTRTPLGGGAVLGKRVWDQGAGIRLVFGNLSQQRLRDLLPKGADHALARWLVRRFIPQDLKVEMELRLAPSESRSSVLGASNPMRLGWTSWVAGPAFRGALPPVQHTLTSDGGDAPHG